MLGRLLLAFLLSCMVLPAAADEIRPAYLQMQESPVGVFSLVWKVPAKGDRKLGLEPVLPENCVRQTEPRARIINNAYIERWIVDCGNSLLEQEISISGLRASSTDVLLHLEFADGRSETAHLTPARVSYRVPAETSAAQLAATYTWLGIEHILVGIDHLLFVFALLLIVREWRRLVATITAFTLAHSVTLAAATLGWVSVPQQPVEAIIALSIVFLAMEIVHGEQGRPGAAARWPWLIAFTFGLLHGFGFAGALAEVGLPQQSIPLALVFFNVGVELGQLFFIALVLTAGSVLRRLLQPGIMQRLEKVAVYTIGGLASFWLIERVAAF